MNCKLVAVILCGVAIDLVPLERIEVGPSLPPQEDARLRHTSHSIELDLCRAKLPTWRGRHEAQPVRRGLLQNCLRLARQDVWLQDANHEVAHVDRDCHGTGNIQCQGQAELRHVSSLDVALVEVLAALLVDQDGFVSGGWNPGNRKLSDHILELLFEKAEYLSGLRPEADAEHVHFRGEYAREQGPC